jgi:methylated-DNA-[protein]-cysteine S-methyltransferase
MRVRYATLKSPVGPVAVAWKGDTVVALHMQEAKRRQDWDTEYAPTRPLERLRRDVRRRFGAEPKAAENGFPLRALGRYFAGDVTAIDDLPVDAGGTPFQARVWAALRKIPAGRTRTYGELARMAGRPGAARAAGGAVARNPIPIIIPCHRAVGSTGRLTGFGGGLPRKRWLLEHEGAMERALAGITAPA